MPSDDPRPQTETDPATEMLIRARSYMERGWCRNALARDANGNGVSPVSEQAVAWCASGALIAAGMPDDGFYRSHPAFLRLKNAIDGQPIVVFNNRQEAVEPVLAAFDRAITGETSR